MEIKSITKYYNFKKLFKSKVVKFCSVVKLNETHNLFPIQGVNLSPSKLEFPKLKSVSKLNSKTFLIFSLGVNLRS